MNDDDTQIFYTYFLVSLVVIDVTATFIGHYVRIFPRRATMLLFGIAIGVASKINPGIGKFIIKELSEINDMMELIVIPLFIFKCAFSMDEHMLLRSWGQIFLLGIPGLLISACGTGLFITCLLLRGIWSMPMGIAFGGLISDIHPVEVIRTLKEFGQTRHLTVLLDGEALIGSGTVIIMHTLLFGLLDEVIVSFYQAIMFFLRYIVGGVIIGLISSKILTFFMQRIYNDAINLLTLTLTVPCLTYYLANEVMFASGVIAVAILGIINGSKRQALSYEMETFLLRFWSFVDYVIDAIVCMLSGFFTVELMSSETVIYDCAFITVTYIISLCGRILTYGLLTPIISRLGYGITFKGMIISIWSGIKGPIPLILALEVYFDNNDNSRRVLLPISALLLVTILINGLTAPLLIKLLGIAEISVLRKDNMNACMRHVQTRRVRTIAALKMDRFLANANWKLVQEVTQLNHPYKQILWNDEDYDDDDNYLGTRELICPDCKRELPFVPSKRNMKEMLREARMRILRSKKMSYIRQYQNGTLCKESVLILCQAIEIAIDTPDALIDLEGLHKYFTRQGPFNYLCSKLASYCFQDTELKAKPPRRHCRRMCYHLIKNRKFDLFIYFVILSNTSFMCLEWMYNPSKNSSFRYSLIACNTLFFFIFLMEFILNIYAYSFIYICKNGFKTYFSSFAKVVGFLILCTQFTDLILDYVSLFTIGMEKELIKIGLVLKVIRLLRLVRLFGLCKAWYPNVTKYLNSRVDARLAFAYDIGKGYVTAEEEVAGILPQMIDYKVIREKCQAQIDVDRLAVTKELGIIQKDKPWIAVSVKTKQAVRSTLNAMKATVDDLKASGWLDEFEYLKLRESVEERAKYVATKVNSVDPLSPRELLKEVTWMSDRSTYHYLYKNVITKIFDPGNIICADGDDSDGIYIIVTGLLKLTYVPKTHTLQRLQSFGILPVMDYISAKNFDQRIEEYLVSGNSIGELCTLTGRPYDCTVIAETACQVYHIRKDVLKKAFTLNRHPIEGLEAKMWKSVSLKLCSIILMDTPAYQLVSLEQTLVELQRGFVPNLSKYTYLDIADTIEDLILVEGVVFDSHTRNYYVAPCYIPRTVRKVHFPKNDFYDIEAPITTKLMIIPAKDLEEVVFGENESEEPEIAPKTSSRCLNHFVMDKLNRITKIKNGESPNVNGAIKRRGTPWNYSSQADSPKNGSIDSSEVNWSRDLSSSNSEGNIGNSEPPDQAVTSLSLSDESSR